MKIKYDYDKENNIFAITWADEQTEVCEEFTTSTGIDFVVDLNKKGEIIGIEILKFKFKKFENEK